MCIRDRKLGLVYVEREMRGRGGRTRCIKNDREEEEDREKKK